MRRGFSTPSVPSTPSAPSPRRSPASPARRTSSPSPPAAGRPPGRAGPAALRGGWRWSWAWLVRGGASVVAYSLMGVALARLAVAIDSRPALVREALEVGLRTLAVHDRGRQTPVLTTTSQKLQPQEEQASTPAPSPPPSPGPAAGQPANAKPLVVWEYRLPAWGDVVYTPDGTPVATGSNQLQETVAAAIQEFQERHPRVDVKVVWLAEVEVLSELARAAASAGELPDLVALPEATIAHPLAVPLARFVPENLKYPPVVRQAQHLAAGAARSFTGEEGPWVIPRWLEWQAWVGSQALWQKLGLDSQGVIRSGWRWSDVTEAVRKSLGARRAPSGSSRAGVYLFPTVWMFAGLLLASERPLPYAWPATTTDRWRTFLRSAPADEKPVELRWNGEFLHQLAGAWQEWTRQAGPQPYSNSALAGWLTAAGLGTLVVGGPVSPALVNYLAGGPAGRPGGTRQQGTTTSPAANLLFLPVPTPAAGAGAALPVRLSGYQLLAGGRVNLEPGAGATSPLDPDRIRLAAELGLVLARRVGAWAVRAYGFLPVDAGASGGPWATSSSAPAGLAALLQTPPRLAARPLLPPAYARAAERALEELVHSAPELAAGRSDPATVTERLLHILQAPAGEARPADGPGADAAPGAP